MTERTLIANLKEKIGQEVTLKGWVDIRRDQGKLIFIDFRDATGKVQMVALPMHAEAHAAANTVRPEWVLEVSGKVNARPEKNVNAGEANGMLEIEVLAITVLNEAQTPPIDVRSDGRDIGEEVRLKYRYLDLRRPRMQHNMRTKHEVELFARNFLSQEGFIEIETPLLSKSTPEGSRDYLVPSRLEQGKFYALPQSPQQYK